MNSSTSRSATLWTSARTGAAVIAAGALLASCASTDSGQSESAGLSADKVQAAKDSAAAFKQEVTTIPITTPLSKRPPEGKLVVMLQDATTAPGEEVFQGVKEGAEALGWRAESIKFDGSDLSEFNAGLLQALQLGADYVVNSGIPATQLSKSTVDAYEAAGVKMLLTTSPVPDDGPFLPTLSQERSRVLAGEKLADWFIGDSEGKGKAVIVNITTYPVLTMLADSFASRVDATCPSCSTETIKATVADLISGALAEKAIAALRSDRSITYAMFDNAAEVGGFDAKLQAAGLDDVKVLSHSIDPVAAKSLQSGQGQAFMAYSFRYDGWDAIDTFARDAVGDEPTGAEDIGLQRLFDKENIGELADDSLYRGPDDALEQFKKLWLVPSS